MLLLLLLLKQKLMHAPTRGAVQKLVTAPSMQDKQAAAPDPCTQGWACTQSCLRTQGGQFEQCWPAVRSVLVVLTPAAAPQLCCPRNWDMQTAQPRCCRALSSRGPLHLPAGIRCRRRCACLQLLHQVSVSTD
jgi:hypothetical protein